MGVYKIMSHYYTAIIFLNIFAMIAIQICVWQSNTLTKSRKRLFHELFTAIIVAAFCEWLGNYLQGTGSSTRLLHIAVKAIELSVAPSIAFLVAWIIERQREKEIYIFLAIHAAAEILSGWFGFIYYVDENSNYSHEDFYWIYILAYTLAIIYGIYTILHNSKRYQYSGRSYFFLIVLFMITGIVIQSCDSSLKVDYLAVGMASVMLYVLILEMVNQTDELTELLNRRGYENYISHIESKCVVLFFDVDGFKFINDTYGHSYGDEVLKQIGQFIRKYYAKYGKCFRYGGDEFCVILVKNIDETDRINEEFFCTLSAFREKESRFPLVSIGYSYYDPENQNVQDAIYEADQMMYKYKKTHKIKAGEKSKRSISEKNV